MTAKRYLRHGNFNKRRFEQVRCNCNEAADAKLETQDVWGMLFWKLMSDGGIRVGSNLKSLKTKGSNL